MKEYSIIKSRKIPEGLEKEKKSEIQNSQPLCKFTPVGINSIDSSPSWGQETSSGPPNWLWPGGPELQRLEGLLV
jgi:hypothetical protein